jgi:hypothetical protein
MGVWDTVALSWLAFGEGQRGAECTPLCRPRDVHDDERVAMRGSREEYANLGWQTRLG